VVPHSPIKSCQKRSSGVRYPHCLIIERTLLGILIGDDFNVYLLLPIYARKSHHLCVTQKFVLLFEVISIFSSCRKLSHELAEKMGKVDYFTSAHQTPAIALQETESANCQENTCELDPGDEWEVVILVWVGEEKAVEKKIFQQLETYRGAQSAEVWYHPWMEGYTKSLTRIRAPHRHSNVN